jgi:hypothetical protein
MNQFEIVAAQLAALGLTITVRPGEYCVNFRGGGNATAYLTDDLDDALNHGRAVAAALPEAASAPREGGRRRKWRRPKSAKAARRAFIRAHNRRMRGRALRQSREET